MRHADLEAATEFIRVEFSRAGWEIVGVNTDSIIVTLPPDFEDLTNVLHDLKEQFSLFADYRFCSETKLGMLILGYDEDANPPPAAPAYTNPDYGGTIFALTASALGILSVAMLSAWPQQHLSSFSNGSFSL